MSLPHRNLSRHATWHQRSYQIALKQGNQNPQNNMIASFSFASTANVTRWSNYLTQRAEILTRQSNLMPQWANNTEWFVCGICTWCRSFFRHKASWLHSFLSFFPRGQQAAVGSLLRMKVILANTSLRKKWSHEVGLDRYLGSPS